MIAASTKTTKHTTRKRSGCSAVLMSHPSTLMRPIVVTDPKSPVKNWLLKITQ